jgi:hypothetical protein
VLAHPYLSIEYLDEWQARKMAGNLILSSGLDKYISPMSVEYLDEWQARKMAGNLIISSGLDKYKPKTE